MHEKAQKRVVTDSAKLKWDKRTIRLSMATMAVMVIWGSFATLDRVVMGGGRIVPIDRTQVIQNLEGGIIRKIMVQEGDRVSKGDVLVELDGTQYVSALGVLEQEIAALTLKRTRLLAEFEDKETVEFPEESAKAQPYQMQLESKLFVTRRLADKTTRKNLNERIKIHREEAELLRGLADEGLVPKVQFLRAQAVLAELESEFQAYTTEYPRDIAQELSETSANIDKLVQSRNSKLDQLERTIIRSPSTGVVNEVLFTTVGAVAGPGDPILKITPTDDNILVEVRVGPQDIGYVRNQMDATLKVTAYDYSIYGTLSGQVVRVGADTVEDPLKPEDPPSFIVSVKINPKSQKHWLARDLELRPGMVVQAELMASETRIIDYIIKPIMDAKSSLKQL